MKFLKRKRILATLAAVFLIFTLTTNVFAGSYTNSNSSINNNYIRDSAKNYADTYYLNPNSAYYNYGDLDCTNFVSQCLSAGSLTQGYDLWNGGYPLYTAWQSWYYISKNLPGGVSYTWTGAHNFRYHWANVNNEGVNRAYKYQTYQNAQAVLNNWGSVYSMLWRGDVIQLVRSVDGITHHSMVVTNYGFNSGNGQYDVKYNQHSYAAIDMSFYNLMQSYVTNGNDDMVVIYEIKNGN